MRQDAPGRQALLPSSAFAWLDAAAGPALVCRPLERFAAHLFTTRHWSLGRQGSPPDSSSWEQVASAIGVGAGRLARLHQVHGANAVLADPASRPDADIVVSNDPNVALAVQSADCVPLLLADARTGAVAAAHAGWRGLAARVVLASVEKVKSAFGSRPGDLIVAAGPSIGACCYEVGEDVRAAFETARFGDDAIARWFFATPQATARNPSMNGVPAARRAGHWFFDGWAATRSQLEAAGVPADRIYLAELCTASHPDDLCSYRRDGRGAGRMAAVVRCGTPRPSPRSRADPRAR